MLKLTIEQNEIINQYIINCIDSDNYEASPETNKEKFQFLLSTFRSEYQHMIDRQGNQRALTEYLSGLPSCFHLDFYNDKILDLAVSWGSISKDASESQKDKILNNWFNFIANRILVLARKNKIDF